MPSPSAMSESLSTLPAIRLLLVEDHADTRNVFCRLFTLHGVDVTGVDSIAAGKRAADASLFDLALIDLGLPDGDGCELMRYLREAHGLPGIAVTGSGMPDDLERCRAAGFAGHILKPFSVGELVEEIRRLTESSPRNITAHPLGSGHVTPLKISIEGYTVVRLASDSQPARYAIYRPDGSQCYAALMRTEVEREIEHDRRSAQRPAAPQG